MSTNKKRVLDDASAVPKSKKKKTDHSAKSDGHAQKAVPTGSTLLTEEVDFPRGGGTSFTPVELKAIRAEGVKEAEKEIFKDVQEKRSKRVRRKSDVEKVKKNSNGKDETLRVEHLNYKRVFVGMKILGQIVSIQPLALIVSLPNQLYAHVPITQISTQLTSALEEAEDEEEPPTDDEDDTPSRSRVPDLFEIFKQGQYIRAVVTAVHAPGATDAIGLGHARDAVTKSSRRVELSLEPIKVNAGVAKTDLRPGFTLSAAVKSIEDHGYILDFGIDDTSGFLAFKDIKVAQSEANKRLHVGQLLDVYVSKSAGNGRTFSVKVDFGSSRDSLLTEVTSVTSVLPGTLVQSLITAVLPDGLNLQLLGFFGGTVDLFHTGTRDPESTFKVGQKVKARVLYDVAPTTPPRFALSLVDHIIKLIARGGGDPKHPGTPLQDAYPVGTILDAVKVVGVEAERGLVVELSPGVEGFVHISQVSDDHVASLSPSSGSWKIGTVHRARVTGYFQFDGLLQLSMRSSILEQKFLQVADVQVGEVIKGTIKKLTDSALFVSISGNVDGVIWPNHYADIILKHPQKRFKPGGSIKCRVLVVDPERKRIALTAKKTLVESSLPIISQLSDAKIGMVTHAVVFKVSHKCLHVEFYNNIKATVPAREASESAISDLASAFPIGKPIQVRIIAVNQEDSHITASIRQASPTYKFPSLDISAVEIGNNVEGVISDVQKDKVLITLQPTQVRALLSLKNLANRRGVSAAQLQASLTVGETLQDLVVTSRNPEKGFVLVATRPKDKEPLLQKGHLSMDTIEIGQLVGGRVLRHSAHGAVVKLTSTIIGYLHPTDACDDYEAGQPFPAVDTILRAVVVDMDKDKRRLTLSTRPSRVHPDRNLAVKDREIKSLDDLKEGETVRGFIKSVAQHGLFVTLGRDIDARVQIKELFDEFVKDWQSRFSANQLIQGRILSIDREKKQVELSFRSGELKREKPTRLTLSDLVEGSKVDGRVKKVEDYGLFIELEGSKLSGLCHKSELSDNKDADVTLALRSFREGDRLKVKILSVDTEKRRISLGLKPSYFTEGDFNSEEASDADDGEPVEKSFGVVEEADDATSDAAPADDDDDDDEESSDDEVGEEDPMDVDGPVVSTEIEQLSLSVNEGQPSAASLKLNGFQWSAEDQENDISADSSSDESGEEEPENKKKKRRRKEVEQDLTADMHTKTPDSNADFERLLLGSPNSSYLWIQYMSFQLQLSEIKKAREIAQRALKTINFREEREKLNVWIALLNLENTYGTEESLEATFKEAARRNDSKTIHLALANILEESDKMERAEEQFKRTAKKFGQSSKVWTLFGEHYLKRGQLEEARKLVPRSLQSLEKRKHLKTISKFAQLEYKFGDPERGKTIFEGVVDSHPKRWDLWSIYLDMEASQNDIASVRNIFERVLSLKMTSHKAKSFFKKWLELERKIGDEDGAALVKSKAIEWTQRAAS